MRHAVLIGSATFDPDSGIEPLLYPANDVAALSDLISTDDFKFDKITTIVDQPKHVVEEALDEILSQSSFHDFLLIYFSGHGKLNAKGDLFLSCRSTKERSLNSTGFRYRNLMDMLNAHDAERVAIILDCCYAGKAISGFNGSPSEQIHSLLDSGRGIFILASSGATQTAQEREADGDGSSTEDGNGIFTKQVIEGLRTGAADIDGDGDISLNDLARYVREEFRRKNVTQEPVVGNYARSGDFILGTNRRLRHQRLLASIQLKFDQSKALFQKVTRRAIEDYLDDIIESPDACEDPRFKALLAFEAGGSIEPVIEAVRIQTVSQVHIGSQMEVAKFAGINSQEPVQNTEGSRLKTRVDLLWWLETIVGFMLALFGSTVMIAYISQVSNASGDFSIWFDGNSFNKTGVAMALVAAPTSVILALGTFRKLKWARLTGRLLMILIFILIATLEYGDIVKRGFLDKSDIVPLIVFVVIWSIPSYLYFFKWKE
jgi:Caspase domain